MTWLWILIVILGIAAIVGIGYGLVRFVFWIAEVNLFWTLIEEGWAKIVGRATVVRKIIGFWRGHIVTKNGKVIDLTPEQDKMKWIWIKEEIEDGKVVAKVVPEGTAGAEKYRNPRFPRFWGGLFWVGIYPIAQILKYHFQWTHLHEDGKIVEHDTKKVPKSHPDYGGLDGVLLKTDQYVFGLPLGTKEQAEDIEGVPVEIYIVLPMRIVDVYKAIFTYRRWLALISGTLKSLLREFVARYRYKEDLLDMSAGEGIEDRQEKKGIPEDERAKVGEDLLKKLWKELIDRISETAEQEGEKLREQEHEQPKKALPPFRVFGIEAQWIGFGVLILEPHEQYRKWTTAAYEADREREVRIIRATGVQQARAKETVGALITMLAEATGKSPDDIQKQISKSPRINKEFREISKDLIARQIAIDGKSFLDIRLSGAEGGTGALASLVALLKRIPPAKEE